MQHYPRIAGWCTCVVHSRHGLEKVPGLHPPTFCSHAHFAHRADAAGAQRAHRPQPGGEGGQRDGCACATWALGQRTQGQVRFAETKDLSYLDIWSAAELLGLCCAALVVVLVSVSEPPCCMRSAASRSGLLSKTSMRLRQAMQRERSAPQVQQLELSGHSGSSISTEGSEHSTAQQGAMAGPVAALLQRDSSGSLSGGGRCLVFCCCEPGSGSCVHGWRDTLAPPPTVCLTYVLICPLAIPQAPPPSAPPSCSAVCGGRAARCRPARSRDSGGSARPPAGRAVATAAAARRPAGATAASTLPVTGGLRARWTSGWPRRWARLMKAGAGEAVVPLPTRPLLTPLSSLPPTPSRHSQPRHAAAPAVQLGPAVAAGCQPTLPAAFVPSGAHPGSR